MEPKIKLFIERAENEILVSESLFKISSEENKKRDFGIKKEITFYSAVISHSYYCIFYCAKAYLFSKNIETKSPHEHLKTYNEFSRLIKAGVLDEELLKIYDEEFVKAEALLKIFGDEKKKRVKFTYAVLPQANRSPAEESIENAQKFFRGIYNLLKGREG